MAAPTDAEVLAERDDVEMVKRPWLWPLKSFLPVTRRTRTGIETGVVRPYDMGVHVRGGVYRSYVSAERMVADGWTVD